MSGLPAGQDPVVYSAETLRSAYISTPGVGIRVHVNAHFNFRVLDSVSVGGSVHASFHVHVNVHASAYIHVPGLGLCRETETRKLYIHEYAHKKCTHEYVHVLCVPVHVHEQI